jgi:hypothetical protein
MPPDHPVGPPPKFHGDWDILSVVACQRLPENHSRWLVYHDVRRPVVLIPGERGSQRLYPDFCLLRCADLRQWAEMHGASPSPIDAGDVLLGSRMDRAGGGCLTSYGHRQSLHSTLPTMGTLVHCCRVCWIWMVREEGNGTTER